MTALAPFTAYFRIVPLRGNPTDTEQAAAWKGSVVTRRGGRWDHWRSMQRIAVDIYEALENHGGTETDPVILPEPGGGQDRFREKYGHQRYGGMVKPQMGNFPSLVTIEGFFRLASANSSDQPTNASQRIISGGQFYRGFNGVEAQVIPGLHTATVQTEVLTLKNELESAISSVGDATNTAIEVFRLEYKNTTYGDRGLHFPRS